MQRNILRSALLVFWCLQASATQIEPKELPQLLAESDHVLVGKVSKVEMVDDHNKTIEDDNARTGPGESNEIKLHVVVEKKGILKTNAAKLPDELVVPLWRMWHSTLGSVKSSVNQREFIFLLKGSTYSPTYPAGFMRDLSERAKIERLIREQGSQDKATEPAPSPKTNGETPAQ